MGPFEHVEPVDDEPAAVVVAVTVTVFVLGGEPPGMAAARMLRESTK